MQNKKDIKNKIDKSPKGRFLKVLWKYYKFFPHIFAAMAFFITLNVCCTVIQPKLLNNLLNAVVNQKSVNGLEWWGWIIVMFSVLLFTVAFTFLSGWFGGKLAKKIEIGLFKILELLAINQDQFLQQ